METWPALDYSAWKETRDTLHLWTQMAGKVKLALCPFLNQWWEVTLHLTPRGLNSGLIPGRGQESFDIDFDFYDHRVRVRLSDGRTEEVALQPRTVADFYAAFMAALSTLGVEPSISSTPSEVQDATPFEQDMAHASYDSEAVQRFHRVMLGAARAMERFRTPFHGKSSPVQFFWGGFDLSTARFNGKLIPVKAEGGPIMEFGEDQENFAVGFWPGDGRLREAAFYAYIVPALEGVAAASVQPAAGAYDAALGEFVLRYEDVRSSASPEDDLVAFFQSAYEATAALAGWDRAALEGHVPARHHAR